jgi:hypothetical protein
MESKGTHTVYNLGHPGSSIFSGYGLATQPGQSEALVGLLMVDRPVPVDGYWLGLAQLMFGHVELYQMTADGSSGIACQMFIADDSREFIKPVQLPNPEQFEIVLSVLLANPPAVRLHLSWSHQHKLWTSQFLLDRAGVTPGQPRFHLGDIVSTPGAIEALERAEQSPIEFLRRHVTGDWGDLCQEDKDENELSVWEDYRILSSYKSSAGEKLWVITEHDRSVTTLLLPSEY